jgi:hypothetical protein
MSLRGDRDLFTRKAKRWNASDVTVEVKNGDEVHVTAPCGESRFFSVEELELLIRKLEMAKTEAYGNRKN